MSNNNFKYTLEKNKDKILLGASIVGVFIIGFSVFHLVKNNKPQEVPQDEEQVVHEDNIRAEYIIGANDKGQVDLIKVESKEVVSNIDLKSSDSVIYSRSNDLESMLAYSDGTFFELVEKEGKLVQNEVLKLDAKQSIKEFKFSKDYIVANTGDKLLVFNLKDQSTYMIDAINVDSLLVVDDKLIFAETNYIHSYNLETKEEVSIEIGDITEDLFEIDGNVVAFNNFGSGKEKTTILKLKADDLYISKAHRHDNENVIAVTPDSDDKDISYIDKKDTGVKTSSYYKLNLDKEQDVKNRISLDTLSSSQEDEFTSTNTVATKGYLYTNKSGNIEIFRLGGEVTDTTIDTNKTFFMPILIDKN